MVILWCVRPILTKVISMQTDKIFHYTSVNSLGLILKSQKIRFSRLDTFDDILEAQTHAGIEFGKCFFASCWTQDEVESIPQWDMYGDGSTGVRIELPVKPFRQIKLESVPGFTVSPEMRHSSPLETRELFGKSYFISPTMVYNDDFFQGHVEYVSDVENRWKEAITFTPDYSGRRTPSLTIKSPHTVVRKKSSDWSFQAEYRFSLFVMPIFPLYEPVNDSLPTVDQMVTAGDALRRSVDPVATYIDVPLDPSVLDHLIVWVGPLCTDEERIKVETLVKELAPKAVIKVSALAGKIRSRKKVTNE